MIPDKARWQKWKKEHDVPKKVCKDVNMGDAFQAFHDNAPQPYSSDPAGTLAALEELAPNVVKYSAALKRLDSTSPVLPELKAAMNTISSLKAQMSSAAEPMRFLKQYHAEATKTFATLKNDHANKHTAAHWDIFYRGPIRNIGLQLDKLVKLEPAYDTLRLAWKSEMTKVNSWMNQQGVRFQFAMVERTIAKNLAKLKFDMVKAGGWADAPRGGHQQPPVQNSNN